MRSKLVAIFISTFLISFLLLPLRVAVWTAPPDPGPLDELMVAQEWRGFVGLDWLQQQYEIIKDTNSYPALPFIEDDKRVISKLIFFSLAIASIITTVIGAGYITFPHL